MEVTPEYLLLNKSETSRLLGNKIDDRYGGGDLLIDLKRRLAFHVIRADDPSRPWRAQVSRPFAAEIDPYNCTSSIKKLEFTPDFTTYFRTKKDLIKTLLTYGHWINNASNVSLDSIRAAHDAGEILPVIYWGGKGYGKLRFISITEINPAPGLPEEGEPETIYYLEVLETDSQTEKIYRLDRLQLLPKEVLDLADLQALRRTSITDSDISREKSKKSGASKAPTPVRALESCTAARAITESFEPKTPKEIPKKKAHVWSYEKEYIRCDDGFVYTYRRESWGYMLRKHEIARPGLKLAELVYWDQLIDTGEWANSDMKGKAYLKSRDAAIEALLTGKLYFKASISDSNKAWRKQQRQEKLSDDILPYSIRSFRKHGINPVEVGLTSLEAPWLDTEGNNQ